MLLDEVAARLHDVAHQGREDVFRLVDMGNTNLQQGAHVGVQRRLPELLRVHFAEPLVARQADALAAELEDCRHQADRRSEEHTSELQSLMRISYAVFCLKKKKNITQKEHKDNKTILSKETNRTNNIK